MSLEGIVGKVQSTISDIKDYFSVPNTAESMREYAIRHYLTEEQKRNIFKGKNDKEIKEIYANLEKRIQQRVDYHKESLDKLSLKIGKGVGLATIINDAYQLYAGTPFDNFFYLKNLLVEAKAFLELPAMYNYFKNTYDVYGAVEWAGTKILAGLIPVLGPAMDRNVAQRIIKKRAIKEGIEYFLKDQGMYEKKKSIYDEVNDRVNEVTKGFKLPTYQPA